jgi:HEAT repeat protein
MSQKNLLPAEKVERLLSRLHAPDESVRIHAALRLTGTGIDVERVRPTLEMALGDPDSHVRRLAAWVLARLAPVRRAA